MANSFFSGALDALGNQTGFNQDTVPTAIAKASNIKVPGSQPSMPDVKDNKYRVEMMTYPNDLLDSEKAAAGGINYIKFFINVQGESKIAKTQANLIEGAAPNNAVMNGIVGKKFSAGGYAAASAIEGAVGGAMVGAVKGASEYGSKGLAGLTGSTAAGAGIGGILKGGGALVETTVLENFADIKFGQPTKRLKSAIALYMPNQLNVRYSMQWSEDEVDLAAYAAVNPAFQKSLEAAQESKLQGNTGQAGGTATAAVGNAIASQILKKNTGLSAAAKAAANPRKEQIFKGVDFRRFTFEYQFAPRNPNEAATVMNIIYQFKYHMHPEFKDASNFIYVYPSEFDIEYFFGSSQNANINKISSCVLTEMNVNYSPNGVFTTFPDGTPTQINLTLQFTELEALTKERIAVGL